MGQLPPQKPSAVNSSSVSFGNAEDPPHPMLACWLVWSYTDLRQPIMAARSSGLQQPYHMQKTAFHSFPPYHLVLTFLHPLFSETPWTFRVSYWVPSYGWEQIDTCDKHVELLPIIKLYISLKKKKLFWPYLVSVQIYDININSHEYLWKPQQ